MTSKSFARLIMGAAILCAASSFAPRVLAAEDHGMDIPMESDPVINDIPHPPQFNPRLKTLWTQVLERKEPDLRQRALDAISQARRQGMVEVNDLAPKIQAILDDATQPELVRLAAAKALITLDARGAAPSLLARDREGTLEMALLVDPALAQWNAAGASELWLSRVKDAATDDTLLRSAVQSLGVVAGPQAADPLRAILLDARRTYSSRLVAARSIGMIAPANAAEIASAFLAKPSSEDRMLAVSALPRPTATGSEETKTLLLKLAEDSEPAIVTVAVEKLMAGAPDTLGPLARKLAVNSDAVVRRYSVDILHRYASEAHVGTLAVLLGDLAPNVRVAAREALIAIDARETLRPTVRKTAIEQLKGDNWRALEQAGYVLGSVHELSVRDRLVDLMRFARAEVRLASIIALRRLAIPDTLPPQFERAKEMQQIYDSEKAKPTKKWTDNEISYFDQELSQLLQNLALGKVTAADGFMQKFIPKGSYGVQPRGAAIWGLGKLHDGDPDKVLARKFGDRLTDTDMRNPEASYVKLMCAVSIGRMRAQSERDSLISAKEDAAERIGEACRWGLAMLDNKPFEPSPPVPRNIAGWFLEPD